MLDLYSGAGGAAYGYRMAGWHVTGVDKVAQPRYAGHVFHQGDALEFLAAHGHEFDAIHASPPCQDFCTLTAGTNQGRTYPRLIAPTRDALDRLGKPYVLENVVGAELRPDLVLCGLMFGLKVFRHRLFELGGWMTLQPPHHPHRGHRVAGWRHGRNHTGDMVAVYGDGGGKGSVTDWQTAMGITWTDVRHELAEAIPPAYTAFIGDALLAQLPALTTAA
jgi:DNA (cytosine-5)-methyltransferase 1